MALVAAVHLSAAPAFGTPPGPQPAPNESAGRLTLRAAVHEPTAIVLLNQIFTTTALVERTGTRRVFRAPAVEPGLLAGPGRVPFQSSEKELFIVQAGSPAGQTQLRKSLLDRGVKIVGYVPNLAYLVWLDARQHDDLAGDPDTQWIGFFRPEWRVSPALLESSRAGATAPLRLSISIVPGDAAGLEKAKAVLSELRAALEAVNPPGRRLTFSAAPTEALLRELSAVPGCLWLEESKPRSLFNDKARTSTSLANGRGPGIAGPILDVEDVWAKGIRGQGQRVSVVDTGLDTGSTGDIHEDFGKVGSSTNPMRIVGYHCHLSWCFDWSDPNGHGTHVAGSVAGNGFLSGGNPSTHQYAGASHAGTAPESELVIQRVFGADGEDSGAVLATVLDTSYSDGARIGNNSWGNAVNGAYDSSAVEVDSWLWSHPDYLAVFAAGNEGKDASPADGVVDTASLGSPASAKNVVSVGSAENGRPGQPLQTETFKDCSVWQYWEWGLFSKEPLQSDETSDEPYGVAATSSRGPAQGDRVKPDVVAPGNVILSTRSTQVTGIPGYGTCSLGTEEFDYNFEVGTSMAAPLVSGAAALVRQYYVEGWHANGSETTNSAPVGSQGFAPSAALIKATLINGAWDMAPGQYGTGATREIPPAWDAGHDLPNNAEGYGRVDVENSLFPHLGWGSSASRKMMVFDVSNGMVTSESRSQEFYVVGSANALIATLVWTDPSGLSPAGTVLVNDLDLTLIAPDGTVYFPNRLNYSGGAPDRVNNVEQVKVTSPMTGKWTCRVNGWNVNGNGETGSDRQPYALVISGVLQTSLTSLTVTKSGAGTGRVTSEPAGIDCGTTCVATFPATTVTLTATADTGSTFAGWSGEGCSGTGSCAVAMDRARSVTATFDLSGGGGGGGGITAWASPNPVAEDLGSTITAVVRGASGAPIPDATVTFSTTFPGFFSGGGISYGSATAVTDETGTATQRFTGQAGGTAFITVESPGVTSTMVQLTVQAPVGATMVRLSAIWYDSTDVWTKYKVTALVTDSVGTPLNNMLVSFGTTSGTASLNPAQGYTIPTGKISTFLTVTVSEQLTVTATVDGVTAATTINAQVGGGTGGAMAGRTLPTGGGTGDCVTYSPDGATMLASAYSRQMRAWSTADYAVKWSATTAGSGVSQVSISDDSQKIVAATGGRGIEIYSLANGSRTCTWTNPDSNQTVACWNGPSSYYSAADAYDGGTGTAYSWIYRHGTTCPGTKGLALRSDPTNRMDCYRPTGTCAMGDLSSGYAYVWNSSGTLLATLAVSPGKDAYHVAFSADGTKLAAVGTGAINVYETSGWTLVANYSAPNLPSQNRYGVTFLDADSKLAVGGDGKVEVVDLMSGASFRVGEFPGGAARALAWNPSTSELAANGEGGNVVVYRPLEPPDLSGPLVNVATPASGTVTLETSIATTGQVSDQSGVATFTINGTPVTPDANSDFSFTVSGLVEGANTITYNAVDTLGNVSDVTRTVTRLVDRVAPVVSGCAVTPASAPAGSGFVVTCTVVDGDTGVATVTGTVRRVGGGVVGSVPMGSTGSGTYSATYDATGQPVGSYAVDVTAVDASPQANAGTVVGAAGFTVTYPAPTVSGIAPGTGPTTGGTSVTVSGTGFRTGAVVTFGGVLAGTTTVTSPTSLTAASPVHAAGTVDVRVTNTDGQGASVAGAFAYAPPANCYTLGTTASPYHGGSVGVQAAMNCVDRFTGGTAIPLVADAVAGYVFSGWTGTGGSFTSTASASTSFTITGNASVTATFTPICYTLATAVSPAGVGSVTVGTAQSCTGGYRGGTVISLTANVPAGYVFSGWTGTGGSFTIAGNASVTATFAAVTSNAARFHTLAPCRVLDTRWATGPFGGPALAALAERTWRLAAAGCGVPATAKAVAMNVTVVTPAAAGFLTLWPSDTGRPLTSTINFRAGGVRANNVVVKAAGDGQASLSAFNGSGGSVHVLVDVTGYFE
ncbi:MAG: hypothetical protein DYH06_06430 [Acidobacteria bacterium ACB2]|nr:hypothetical protein [Acidobacteria bacterium ACB2]